MIFEVCCGCTDDAVNAFLGGADRIELNSALFMGGLTPSTGTLRLVKELTDFPVMAMLRPREGGFCYSENEYKTIKEDAKILLENGADGLVFGFLNSDGTVNAQRTRELIELCGEKDSVFSRGIDVTPNIIEATELLRDLGITRILTSGGEKTALLGAENIKKMIAVAGGTEILPGSGINADNVLELILKTGTAQVHASARKLCFDASVRTNSKIFFGGNIDGKFIPEDEYKITDFQLVRKIKEIIG